MRQQREPSNVRMQDDRLQVPTKAEILDVLQQDGSRAGLQLEYVLDHCNKREGQM
ncbi:hypothetical protein [Loktanella sp. Alg231-35]|uniref:hypothetical protein n=1 Tax=Loktanella sp. Alg231-35 TaxID=1922220 RepID=UPI00131EE3CA|nr:hypothetical protein [Loktanella sp. Alg231-35]